MKPTRTTKLQYLVQAVAPIAAEARSTRQLEESFQEGRRAALEAQAEERRQNAPHPLDAARAKFDADTKAAKEKDAFVITAQNDVFVSGTTLRERKEEATRAIRRESKNKSSTEIIADLQRKERQDNEC